MTLNSTLEFGKYKGNTVKETMESDPYYIMWCIEMIDWFVLDDEANKFFNRLLKTYFRQDDLT